MNVPHSSLRAFLFTAKSSLKNAIKSKSPVNLVIGNESADLDSITSSILYAYLRSTQSAPNGFPALYIPLLNLPASDIRIRPELIALLPHANIDVSHLITLDDLPPLSSTASRLDPAATRWILVDHNALQGPLGAIFASRVFGCVDHHVDEGRVPQSSEADGGDPRIITKTGSCTSLVVNHFRSAWDSLSQSASSSNTAQGQSDAIVGMDDEAVRRTWDMQVAKFAMASVLIDTNDLKDNNKVTEHDLKAVQYLENKIFPARQGAKFERDAFFAELSGAKRHLDGLTVSEILRKDYKQWSENGKELGVASIVKPLSYLVEKEGESGFYSNLDTFAKERNLAALVLMTTSTDKERHFQRQLMIRIMDPSMNGFLRSFTSSNASGLKLEDCDEISISGEDKSTKVWWQRDTSKSRKQVGPLLREALKL